MVIITSRCNNEGYIIRSKTADIATRQKSQA